MDFKKINPNLSCVVVIAEYTKDGELNMFKINKKHNTDEFTIEEFIIIQLNEFKSDRAKCFGLDDNDDDGDDLDNLGFLYECEIIYLTPK